MSIKLLFLSTKTLQLGRTWIAVLKGLGFGTGSLLLFD